MKNKLVTKSNARSKDQQEVMEKIEAGGYCPFCRDNFDINHKKPILYEGKHWLLTESNWPYSNCKIHLLIVSLVHTESPSNLSNEAFTELLTIFRLAESKYEIKGGALAMRFGESKYNSSTVNHLHAHIIYPDVDSLKEKELVTFYIGKPQTKENGNNSN